MARHVWSCFSGFNWTLQYFPGHDRDTVCTHVRLNCFEGFWGQASWGVEKKRDQEEEGRLLGGAVKMLLAHAFINIHKTFAPESIDRSSWLQDIHADIKKIFRKIPLLAGLDELHVWLFKQFNHVGIWSGQTAVLVVYNKSIFANVLFHKNESIRLQTQSGSAKHNLNIRISNVKKAPLNPNTVISAEGRMDCVQTACPQIFLVLFLSRLVKGPHLRSSNSCSCKPAQ